MVYIIHRYTCIHYMSEYVCTYIYIYVYTCIWALKGAPWCVCVYNIIYVCMMYVFTHIYIYVPKGVTIY